jgi:hypothetical protein
VREYGSVSPQFWIGKTGKSLRGDPSAQVLALYLMTSPHANMIGVFHCPVMYMAHETGLGFEGASKALESLVARGFCLYDHESETVFVIRMAAHQVGEDLDVKDNKVKGVHKELSKIAVQSLKDAFISEYAKAYHIKSEAPSKPLASPDSTPSKQLTGQEQEQEQEGLPKSPEVGDKDADASLVKTTRIGRLCKRIRQDAKLMGVNPHDPMLIALLDAGYGDDEIFEVCREAVEKQRPWAWAHKVIQSRRDEATKVQAVAAESRASKFKGGI